MVNRPQIGLSTNSQREVDNERLAEKQASVQRGQRLQELEKEFQREQMMMTSRLAFGASEDEVIRDLESQLEQRRQQRVNRPRFENVQSQGRAPLGRQIEAGLFGLTAAFPAVGLLGSLGESIGETAAGLVVNPTDTIRRAQEIADDRGGVHGIFDPLVFASAAARETSPGPATVGGIAGGVGAATTAVPKLGKKLALQFVPPKDPGIVAKESPVAAALTQRLTNVLRKAAPARKAAQEEIDEVRRIQAERLQAIRNDPKLTPAQKAVFARSAQQGEFAKRTFELGKDVLSPSDVVTLRQAILTSKSLQPFDAINLDASLMKVFGGEDILETLTRDKRGRFIKPTRSSRTEITGKGILPTDDEIEKLGAFFGSDFADALRKKRALGPKIWAETVDALNLSRTMLASFGIDALRQGAPMIAAHPISAGRAFRAAWKAARDPEVARQIQIDLMRRPNVQKLVNQGGLELTIFGRAAGKKSQNVEEGFVSRMGQVFPWVRVSERANVAFFNTMRADIGDGIMREWDEAAAFAKAHGGKVPSAAERARDIKSLGGMLNVALGRGNLGPLQKWAPILNAFFFSPRLVSSRFQLPFAWISRSPAVRKQIARDLAIFTTTNVAILGMIKAMAPKHVEVELDPRSSDFGQLQLGPQRVDFWGGLRQVANLAARLAPAEGQPLGTGTTKTTGTEAEIPIEAKQALKQFFRFKLSPQGSALADYLEGETALGEDPDVDNQVWDRVFPLVAEDITEAYKEQGIAGAAISSFSLIGLNTNTYLTTQDIVDPFLETTINVQAQDGSGRITSITDSRLTPTQRSQIMSKPEIQELLLLESTRSKQDQIQIERNARRQGRIANDYALILGEKDGQAWRQDLLQTRLVAAAISSTRETLTGRGPVSNPENDNERALNQYFELVDAYRIAPESIGLTDFDPEALSPAERQAVSDAFDVVGFGEAADQYLAGLDPAQRQFVLDNVHPDRTPVENLYYEAQEILEDYWDVPDNLITNPATLALYDQYRRYTASNARNEFLRKNRSLIPWIKRIEARREQMRLRNRAIDDMLIAFYGGSPQHPANIRESSAGNRISQTRARIFEDAEERLSERVGIR